MTSRERFEEIERLVERRERDPRTHTFAALADLYLQAGELDRALEVVQDGLRHHPHFLNARLVQAKLLRELGRDRDAAAAFRQVLEIDAENGVARKALAELDEGVEPVADHGAPPAMDRRPRAAQWLARLDDEWRKGENNGASASAADEGHAGEADPEEFAADADAGEAVADPDAGETMLEADAEEEGGESVGDAAGDGTEREGAMNVRASNERDLETATLAQLYVSQGLVDQAIGIYERLLARDPYNARLAASLEEARQRARLGTGATRNVRPARPPRPEPDQETDIGAGADATGDSVAGRVVNDRFGVGGRPEAGGTIREFLRGLIDAPAGSAVESEVDWSAWLRDLGGRE